MTAARVGLLLGGDFAASLHLASGESFGGLEVKRFERVRDLAAFFLSDEHAALRRELDLPAPELVGAYSAMNSSSAPAAGEST
jgi:hypothetical protein